MHYPWEDDLGRLACILATIEGFTLQRSGKLLPKHKSEPCSLSLQTLRLIKYICGKGASDFKRGMSKQAGTVR